MAMTLLSTYTVGSGGIAEIEFTGIAQTGIDLLITISARGTYGATHIPLSVQINGNTGANYAYRNVRVTTSLNQSFGSSGNTNQFEAGYHGSASGTSGVFGCSQIYIPNYTSSGKKIAAVENTLSNNSVTQYDWFGLLYAGGTTFTGAVTSLKFFSNYADNLAQYTAISLYTIS